MEESGEGRPMFSAVSSSARQLYLLLRCISFATKAQVQLSANGMRFGVEDSSIMEGLAFLGKDLFTSYQYNPLPQAEQPSSPASDQSSEPQSDASPPFEVSLPSLLETLQIFGLTDISSKPNPWSHASTSAFSTHVLGISGLCRLRYDGPGAPLTVVLEESGITTTCELVTYEPRETEDIPFSREALALKVIMRASWLRDALSELDATNPEVLTIVASPKAPYLSLSASGPLGSAIVDFTANDKALLETFSVAPPQGSRKVVNSYKFALIKAAHRAMGVATKVSIRGDEQGVLSLQFMIEVDVGKVSFVDFRFVPMAESETGEGDSDTSDEEYQRREGMDEDGEEAEL